MHAQEIVGDDSTKGVGNDVKIFCRVRMRCGKFGMKCVDLCRYRCQDAVPMPVLRIEKNVADDVLQDRLDGGHTVRHAHLADQVSRALHLAVPFGESEHKVFDVCADALPDELLVPCKLFHALRPFHAVVLADAMHDANEMVHH